LKTKIFYGQKIKFRKNKIEHVALMHMHHPAKLHWEFKICIYQGCTMGFSKMCHFAQKIKEKKTRVE
jgi:hypothetical protein